MTDWTDVAARARGLSGRLLREEQLVELSRCRDLLAFARQLASVRGTSNPDSIPAAIDLERAERRRAGAQVRLLARWAGSRSRWLAPLMLEEDCRSIRAAVRGALAGTPAETRMNGAIPTAALPERALAQLAAAGGLGELGALLAVWSSPFAPPVLGEAARQQPDVLDIENALMRIWAAGARAASRRAGRAMRLYTGRAIDAANASAALLVAGHGFDGRVEDLFLEGGRVLHRETFLRAAASRDHSTAVAILEPLVRHSPLSSITSRDAAVEERAWRALAREQVAIARLDPLGPALIIAYWLRLRIEGASLQRIIWAIAAGAPLERRRVAS